MSCPAGKAKETCRSLGSSGVARSAAATIPLTFEESPLDPGILNLHSDWDTTRERIDEALGGDMFGFSFDGSDFVIQIPDGFIVLHRCRQDGFGAGLFDHSGRLYRKMMGFGSSAFYAIVDLCDVLMEENSARKDGFLRAGVGDRVRYDGREWTVARAENGRVELAPRRGKNNRTVQTSRFQEVCGLLPPYRDGDGMLAEWQEQWAERGPETPVWGWGDEWRRGYDRLQAQGYLEFFIHPELDGKYVLCIPDRGLDGSEVILDRNHPLALHLRWQLARKYQHCQKPPDRFPYRMDETGVENALNEGISVPLEVLARYPSLIARFGFQF